MLNKIFTSVLLGLFAILVSIIFISCEKDKETIAVIIVKDFNNNTISEASVTLHQDGQISDQGDHTNPDLHRTEETDANGRAEFTYILEAVLNIEVIKYAGNDTLTGANIVRLLQEKTVTTIVEIN